MKGPFDKSQGGQTLIEVLVAMTAAVVVVSAITTAVISSLNNAQYSKNQTLASQYAQEGMEILRKIKSSDWTTFNNYAIVGGDFCLNKAASLLSPSSDCIPNKPNVDIFIRKITIDKSCTTNQIKATVSVSWSDAKCVNRPDVFCNSVKISSCFSDFNVVPSP